MSPTYSSWSATGDHASNVPHRTHLDVLTSTALATTWTVDDDGKADFDNIQSAIDASSDGDEILVAPSRRSVIKYPRLSLDPVSYSG